VTQCVLAFLLQESSAALPDGREAGRIFNIMHDALLLRAEETEQEVANTACSLTLMFIDRKEREVVTAWVGTSMCVRSHGDGSVIDVLTQAESCEEPFAPVQSMVTMPSSRKSEALPEYVSEVEQGNPAIARRLGALNLHEMGSTHYPGVHQVTLEDVGDQFLLCGSTGIWDAIEKEEAVKVIVDAGRQGADKGVETLLQNVMQSWAEEDDDEETDDASLVLLWF